MSFWLSFSSLKRTVVVCSFSRLKSTWAQTRQRRFASFATVFIKQSCGFSLRDNWLSKRISFLRSVWPWTFACRKYNVSGDTTVHRPQLPRPDHSLSAIGFACVVASKSLPHLSLCTLTHPPRYKLLLRDELECYFTLGSRHTWKYVWDSVLNRECC